MPLWQKNAEQLAKEIIGLSQKYLPGRVIGYELGNEVRHCARGPESPRLPWAGGFLGFEWYALQVE